MRRAAPSPAPGPAAAGPGPSGPAWRGRERDASVLCPQNTCGSNMMYTCIAYALCGFDAVTCASHARNVRGTRFPSAPIQHTPSSCKLALTQRLSSLRTNGVNTNGAAAKVTNFDSLGKICHTSTPWHFWEDKSRLTGVPKKYVCQKKHLQ